MSVPGTKASLSYAKPGDNDKRRLFLKTIGDKCLKHSWLKYLMKMTAPPQVLQLGEDNKDSLSESFILVISALVIIFAIYLGFFIAGFIDCRSIKYLSIEESDQCETVRIALASEHNIDDSGNWDTSESWSFSTSMTGALFVGYTASIEHWQEEAAPSLYQAYSELNDEFETSVMVENLLAMVVSDVEIGNTLKKSSGYFHARVQADPKFLMNGNLFISVALKYTSNYADYTITAMTYTDQDEFFEMSMEKNEWSLLFPNTTFATNTFDGVSNDILGLTINKYSVWVASAVNMNLLTLDNLKILSNNSEATEYILFKFYDKMDPIECEENVDGTQYCWLPIDTVETTKYGVRLFPTMSHYISNCNTDCDYDADTCNEVDLTYRLWFDPNEPSGFNYVNFSTNTYQQGTIYLNPYKGISYLNELFYEIPNTHCTRPIALAASDSRNKLACGSSYQKKKGLESNYCSDTPLAIEEKFYKCTFSASSCLSSAVGEAQGWAVVAHTFLMLALVYIVTKVQVPGAKADVVAGVIKGIEEAAQVVVEDKDNKVDNENKISHMENDINFLKAQLKLLQDQGIHHGTKL